MKIHDYKNNKYVEKPQNIINFLDEIEVICRKYNLSISHEDGHGSFLIEGYDQILMEWLKEASMNFDE